MGDKRKMTDEELKKKCIERVKIFQQAMESCHSSSPIDCIEWFADRISDLEKENAELEAQIEKMKNCRNCKKNCEGYRNCTLQNLCYWEWDNGDIH
jgi:predicted ATP-binding protein involved in virulence